MDEPRTRTYGLLCIASAVIGVVIGFSDVLAGSGVPRDQWSYPLTPAQLWIVSIPLAVDHVLQALGFVGIGILRPYAASRSTDRTVQIAVWGFGLFAVAELASALIGGQSESSGVAYVVDVLFLIATLMTALGGIVAGVAIVRRGTWSALAGWSVLLTGPVLLFIVTPANITGSEALRTIGLVLWSVLFVPIGLAVARGATQEVSAS